MKLITVTLNTSVDRTLEVPRMTVGGHLKGRLVRVQPGGKGVNVSRCLAVLGVPSVVTGFVGSGELAFFRESFAGTPVAIDSVPIAGATRSCTTILDPEVGTDTHIREQGAHVADAEINALQAKLRELSDGESLLVFCGSLPPGMTDEHLAALLAAVRERGAEVAADLNGPELGVAVAAHAAAIKPNVEELGECLGQGLDGAGEEALLAAARSLCDRVGTVLLTRGRQGALAVRRGEALAAAVEIPAPRNTVGCGDAFLAGYLAAQWRGGTFDEAVRLAAACGAAQALADAPGQIAPDRVRELAAQAVVRRLP